MKPNNKGRSPLWFFKSLFAIISLICLECTTLANIVELGDFRLPAMNLVRKQYFSFSDVGDSSSLDETTEDSAMITFDLAMMPQHTLKNSTYALTIICAHSETSEMLQQVLSNGTTTRTNQETGVR